MTDCTLYDSVSVYNIPPSLSLPNPLLPPPNPRLPKPLLSPPSSEKTDKREVKGEVMYNMQAHLRLCHQIS